MRIDKLILIKQVFNFNILCTQANFLFHFWYHETFYSFYLIYLLDLKIREWSGIMLKFLSKGEETKFTHQVHITLTPFELNLTYSCVDVGVFYLRQ